MSANNEVLIEKRGDKYVAEDIDIDTGSGHVIASENNLEDAIKAANKYMSGNIVEYGLNIKL